MRWRAISASSGIAPKPQNCGQRGKNPHVTQTRKQKRLVQAGLLLEAAGARLAQFYGSSSYSDFCAAMLSHKYVCVALACQKCKFKISPAPGLLAKAYVIFL